MSLAKASNTDKPYSLPNEVNKNNEIVDSKTMGEEAMNDLAETLGVSFKVSMDYNSTDAQHPRLGMYKNASAKEPDQNLRRAKFLLEQKERRFDSYLARRIALGEEIHIKEDEEEETGEGQKRKRGEDEEDEVVQGIDKYTCLSSKPKRTNKKHLNPYKNQLMLSEWLEEVPLDFHESWYSKMCPVGKRCMVVASNGKTVIYLRNGYKHATFKSGLPGGHEGKKTNEYCLLDCILDEPRMTLHVLDLMCWRGQPMYDSDTEFRFYWLATKVNEDHPELADRSPRCPYIFKVLPYVACTPQSLAGLMSTEFPWQRDGLLFYHKSTHYSPGRNPACLWLKPHMTEGIIGIPDLGNNNEYHERYLFKTSQRATKKSVESMDMSDNTTTI